jgi:putative colanic acid biosynthesis UDP-glucose lipid carrier transferase
LNLVNYISTASQLYQPTDIANSTKRGYSRFIKLIHFLGDMLFLNFSFLFSYFLKFKTSPFNYFHDNYVSLLVITNLSWLIVVNFLQVYEIKRITVLERIVVNLLKSIGLHALVIIGFIFCIQGFYFSRMHLLLFYIIYVITVMIWRVSFVGTVKNLRVSGKNFKRVVVIGANSVGNQVYNFFESFPSAGYRFEGFFDNEPEKCVHAQKVKGSIEDVKAYASANKIDEIFCTLPLTETKTIRDLMTFADNNLIRFKIIPDLRGFLNKKVNLEFYDKIPIMTLREEPMESSLNRDLKRLFDIVFSLLVILLIFPWLFPLIAIAMKISSPGPIFFKQKRNGKNNEEFTCYKFRTMRINNESDSRQAEKNDSRITKFGKFLRKTNLDELPQFFNVLIGNMSVIGPRPHMLKHTEEYSIIINKFMVRHLVKPGITGWAQVNGYRGGTEDQRMMLKRVRYDVWYIENWSFLLDIKIVFMTVFNMTRGEKNAY